MGFIPPEDMLRRARRRKSLWNVPLLVLNMVVWWGIWYLLFRLVWSFHTTVYPQHQFKDFWGHDPGPRIFILSFLMMFSIAPGALLTAGMIVNTLFWLIPPARRTLDAEAKNYPETAFRNTMRKLFKWWLWLFPAGLILSLLAAFFLKSLR